MTIESGTQAYFHGDGEAEQRRLEVQATLLGGAEFLPPFHPGMHVLEVGCGTGAIAREVARMVAPGHVTAIDRSVSQLAAAARLAAAHGVSNITFLEGDVGTLDLPDASVDAAYCRFLLEHVAAPLQVVSELRRVLRPGGWACALEWEAGCIVNYPDSPAVDALWHNLYRWQQTRGGDPWVGRKLYGLFARAGFVHVAADGRAWAVTGAPHDAERLAAYIAGAREIIGQARDAMIAQGFATPDGLHQAEAEYEQLAAAADTFIFHGFCRAVAERGPAD